MPFWLEDFIDNLIPTEVHAPAHISQDSKSEHPVEALPRAEKFGDLITTEHKVLNERCESRDNHGHWYAVVVHDLATQWMQSYQCRTKSAHETENFIKILRAVALTESCIHRQLDGILGEHVMFYHGITTLQHLIAERAVRRVKEGTSAVLLQL